MKNYDLAIIGSGPGGYIAGLYASGRNLKVCVIENDLTGGTCLNKGCIPTKVMLNSASIFAEIKYYPLHGIDISSCALNFSRIIARKNEVVSKLRTGIETLFRAKGIDLIKGTAKLSGPNVIAINNEDALTGKNIIIATGSRPIGFPGTDLDEVDICSSDGMLNMNELPRSAVIIGGGVIGVEFASFLNAYGVKVTIIELLDRLIPAQSKEVSRKLEMLLKKRGIDIFISTKVESIKKMKPITVNVTGGKAIEAEKVLVSIGRKPNTEGLGLEIAGITTANGRIEVDKFLRTSSKNIYAIGDCINGPLLAHKASYDGILACDNILGAQRQADYSNIPSAIYTDPEIASIGLTEEEARQKYPDVKIAKFPYLGSGKAYLIGKQEGFIKIMGDSKGRLLGVEIFGKGACDLISEAAVALCLGANIKDLSRVVHPHPTLSEIFQEAFHIFCGTPLHGL